MDVRFVAIKEEMDLNGKPSTQSQVIAMMFGMLAEIGRELISERTKEALVIARRSGRIGGRPTALNPQQQELAVKFYQEGKHSIHKICQMMGISKPTLYSYLKKANSTLKNPKHS